MLKRLMLVLIRCRAFIYALACVVFGLSLVALMRLPIDALPNLSENQVLVYTLWPDHSPEQQYEQITRPLARQLEGVRHVTAVRGSSDVGFSLIYVIFDENIELHEARQLVFDQLRSSELALPQGVEPRVAPAGLATGQIFAYVLRGHDTDLLELRSWHDNYIAPRLSKVKDVAEVASVGGFEPVLQIELNGLQLNRYELSFSDVMQQLEAKPADPQALSTEPPVSTRAWHQQQQKLNDLPIKVQDDKSVPLSALAHIELRPQTRYGAFEQDGDEVVAGIVHMQPSGNTLRATQDLLRELRSIQRELPNGWTCLPCYDRSPLITSAISTVTKTLIEALLVTTVCIILIMRHWRAWIVIAVTLPLAVLGAVLGMTCLPWFGQPINANIMSLAGIAVSIGILVDASVVILENVHHRLHQHFGSTPVSGETNELVADAAAQVATPAAMAIVIMLVSYLPVFALGGLDGQMLRPLLWTKTFVLISVILIALSLVPCLARDLLRGPLKGEHESRILRSVRNVYEPILITCFSNLSVLTCMLGLLAIVAAAAIGVQWVVAATTILSLSAVWFTWRRLGQRLVVCVMILLAGLSSQHFIQPLQLALRIPLDEGMIMDMPITVPRTNIRSATDDLKARNMVLCRFPEIAMVSGKVGRAETAFDPAPVDMIETMVEYRRQAYWPRRRLLVSDAAEQASWLLDQLVHHKLLEPPADRQLLSDECVTSGLQRFDAVSREVCWQQTRSFEEQLSQQLLQHLAEQIVRDTQSTTGTSSEAPMQQSVAWLANQVPPRLSILLARQLNENVVDLVTYRIRQACQASESPLTVSTSQTSDAQIATWTRSLRKLHSQAWRLHTRQLNATLQRRAAATWNHIVVDELVRRVPIVDEAFRQRVEQQMMTRYKVDGALAAHHGDEHSAIPGKSDLPILDPHPTFDRLIEEATRRFDKRIWLWPHTIQSLTDANAELDLAVQMPGWANVWTRPIQNRVDMLTSGVNAEVGIRVTGQDFAEVVSASEQIAELVRQVPGASGVIADPIRGKDETRFVFDEERIANIGLNIAECQRACEAASSGVSLPRKPGTAALRVMLQPGSSSSAEAATARHVEPLMATLLPLGTAQHSGNSKNDRDSNVQLVTLGTIARLEHLDGPATIKSTSAGLCNHVRLNVVGRSAMDWVAEAKQLVGSKAWPSDLQIEWVGQYEHAVRTQRALRWIIPCCCLLIALVIWLTFRDWFDSLLVLGTLPGATIGAIVAQWLMDLPISLNVVVGYISCLGMAAATAMIMLVYLRDELARAGGLENITSGEQLEAAVIRGAVHRLRPKLLTEAAMIFSLVPLLWSSGAGADVIRPMAAPVLGGILLADELIDLVLPTLFLWNRRYRWSKAQSARRRPRAGGSKD